MNRYKPRSFLLFLMLLISFIISIGTPVQAFGSDLIETFEDDVLGEQAYDDFFGYEWFYSSQNTAGASVDNTDAHGGSKSYRVADNHHVLFTMNVSEIYNISFWTSREGAQVGSYIHYVFTNATNHTIIEIRQTNDGTGKFYYEFKEWDNSWNRIGNDVENTEWVKFTFNITSIQDVTYTWMTDTEEGTPNHIGATLDEMAIKYVYWYIDSVAGNNYVDLDDFIINPLTPLEDDDETQKSIYFRFKDFETNADLYMYGTDYTGQIGINWEGIAKIESPIVIPGYKNAEPWGYTLEIETGFTNGDYTYINFTGIEANCGSGCFKTYNDKENYLQLYENQIYTIYFGSTTVDDGFENGFCKDLYGGLEVCLYTDKQYYDAGEQTLFKYKLPTPEELDSEGYLSGGWEIWVYDNEFKYNLFWDTDGGDSAELVLDNLVYDNQYHYRSHTFPTPTTGIDHYKVYIGQKGVWFDEFLVQAPVHFYVSTTGFTPNGNITSISPNPPEVGQDVVITFNASNNGLLQYKKYEESAYNTITMFSKPPGNVQVTTQFWEIGYYILDLKVSAGEDMVSVDKFYFWVNDTNGTAGGYGYNVEYLTVDPHFAVAGNDTIYISYRTLVNDTRLIIIDARNQTTQYSTMVNAGAGTHKFTLPNYATIGEWNITLYGNTTLNTSFFVIAQENNYVEFDRNVYFNYDYQSKAYGEFQLNIRHDRPVILSFSMDGKPQGRDIYLDTNQQPNGVFPIPVSMVKPEPGNWEVVMHESNNLIKRRVLSRDTCEVRQGTITKAKLQEPGFDNIFQMLSSGAIIFGGGEFGLAFMALMITVVFMFVMTSADKQHKNNDMVFLVGCAFFLFFAYIGWLPVWLVLLCILLTALVFGEWLSKKINLGG